METFFGNCGGAGCNKVARLVTDGFPQPGYCVECIAKERAALRGEVERLNKLLDWCEGEFKHFCIDTSYYGLRKRRAGEGE